MKYFKKRLERVESLVKEDEGLTEQDVELILSCLPQEVADAVLDGLFGGDIFTQEKKSKSPTKSGLHGKTLEQFLKVLPPDHAAALKAKVEARGI